MPHTPSLHRYRWIVPALAATMAGVALVGVVSSTRMPNAHLTSGPPGAPNTTGTMTAAPQQVNVTVNAGSLGVDASSYGTYPLPSVAIDKLIPGMSVSRGFTVTNTGTVPIASISIELTPTGSSALVSAVSTMIEQCTSSGCAPIAQDSSLAQFAASPIVIYSGTLNPGQSANFVVTDTLSQGAPQSLEGQTVTLDYSLVAVGA